MYYRWHNNIKQVKELQFHTFLFCECVNIGNMISLHHTSKQVVTTFHKSTLSDYYSFQYLSVHLGFKIPKNPSTTPNWSMSHNIFPHEKHIAQCDAAFC